jgi:hypothetical protein
MIVQSKVPKRQKTLQSLKEKNNRPDRRVRLSLSKAKIRKLQHNFEISSKKIFSERYFQRISPIEKRVCRE